MIRTIAMAVTMLAVLGACGAPQTRAEKIAAMSGNVTNGKTLYDANCSSCHGTDGKGITGSGADLVGPAKNDSAADVIGTIINGKPGTTMLSYATQTDQVIADLYTYIKATFGK